MVDEKTPAARSRTPKAIVFLAILAMVPVFAALLFLPAGRFNWPSAWATIGIMVAFVMINWICLLRWNPELIERRMRVGAGTKTWDKIWAAAFTPLLSAVYIVAGFDARDGAASLPVVLWPLGLAIFLAGAAMLTWSMVVNPFFEKTVRIQTDHNQYVIDTGPYAFVRHPGYAGFVGVIAATPLLLGSARACIPALLSLAALAVRTALEDNTLKNELAGYGDYASRVGFRLIPGLW